MTLHQLTIARARTLLDKKEISARELTTAVLDRIAAVEKQVGAYITVCHEGAVAQAEAADAAIARGEIAPLTGIPLAIKDLICTQGIRTTCGSKILENFIPPYDAFVIQKLKAQGAVLVGKTNMDEFAMGSSNEHSAIHLTHNPWDRSRIPGGSSGGSAAAVAADMCIGALGSDTGGSIRQPASHCGVTGLKPTYGRVSRFGLVAFASSLDQIGPIGKTTEDCAILLNAIAGHDPADSTSVPRDLPDFTRALQGGPAGMKAGIPREYWEVEGLDPEVSRTVKAAIDRIRELGMETVEISLPRTRHAIAAYYVIAPSEASSNLARYDGVKYGYRDKERPNLIEMYQDTRFAGFGPEVQRRILIGTYCLSAGYYEAYYGKASQVRTRIMADFKKAFAHCDVILSPVAPTPPVPIGQMSDDPLTMYLSDIYTLSLNMAGAPGISVPCGFSSDGLPIGLQIMGPHFMEEKVFKVAYNFEQATDYHRQKPALD